MGETNTQLFVDHVLMDLEYRHISAPFALDRLIEAYHAAPTLWDADVVALAMRKVNTQWRMHA